MLAGPFFSLKMSPSIRIAVMSIHIRYRTRDEALADLFEYIEGCCQTDSNPSQFPAESVNLPGTKLAPLGESSGAVTLEVLS